MPTLEMGNNVYKMDAETISKLIDDNIIGNYALGFITPNNSFVVKYVGRSEDLKKRLLGHLNDESKYSYFKFSLATSIKEAYLKECKNFHDFGGTKYLDNKIHPAKPDGIRDSCPYCGL